MQVELVNDGPVTLLLEVCSRLPPPMPPEDRFVCRFAAEPPQDALPYGRWADTLQAEFLAACLRIDTDGEDLGEAGEITWFPDRTWNGPHLRAGDRAHDDGPRAVRLRLLRARRRRTATSRSRATSPLAPTSPTRRPRANPTGGWTSARRSIGGWRGEGGNGADDDARVGRAADRRGGIVATAELARPLRRPVRGRRGPLHADRARTPTASDYLEIELCDVRGERARPRVALRRRRRGRRRRE